MVTLFETRGYLDDWERTHQAALMSTRAAGNVRGTAALLSSLGTLYINRRQYDRSRSVLVEALGAFEVLDDPRGQALCQRDLALLDRADGDHDSAFDRYTVALREFARVDDAVGRGVVLAQSAPILYERGQVAEAHALLAETMGIFQEVGYTDGIPHALRRIGQFQQRSGDYETAAATMTEVLNMVRHNRDVIGEAYVLCSLGEIKVATGQPDQARPFFQQALTLREQIMDRTGAAVVRNWLQLGNQADDLPLCPVDLSALIERDRSPSTLANAPASSTSAPLRQTNRRRGGGKEPAMLAAATDCIIR